MIWKIKDNLWQGDFFSMFEKHVGLKLMLSCSRLSEMTSGFMPIIQDCPHLYFPFDDADYLPDMATVTWLAQHVLAQSRLGTVLVNCNAGRNRSGLILGLALLADGVKDVVSVIHAAHPQALSNQTFVDCLKALEVS